MNSREKGSTSEPILLFGAVNHDLIAPFFLGLKKGLVGKIDHIVFSDFRIFRGQNKHSKTGVMFTLTTPQQFLRQARKFLKNIPI